MNTDEIRVKHGRETVKFTDVEYNEHYRLKVWPPGQIKEILANHRKNILGKHPREFSLIKGKDSAKAIAAKKAAAYRAELMKKEGT
tara:strand:+ start:2035 stop:2292 length:258 start_codon:yes stop_codon:yes gene_type:complete